MTDLKRFLVAAKRNTYATQKGAVASSRKGARDLAYAEDRYYYLDSYLGERDFSGEEIVYCNERPVWSMNYYGKMLIPDIPEGFIEVLREALQRVTEDRPYRGPREYREGNFRYECAEEGTPDFFNGTERIYYSDQEIYRLYFHGGRIQYS